MKKVLLLGGILLVASSAAASAAGVNLSWDNCGAEGRQDKTFGCTTSTGSAVFVASVKAPAGIGRWTSFETEIQLVSDTATLPSWWQLRNQVNQAGQCRHGALSSSQDFTGAPYAGACEDAFMNQGAGGIASYLVGFNSPNQARLTVVYSVPTANQVPLSEDVEYFAMRGTIQYAKSVGASACAGCSNGVCLICTYVRCVQPGRAPGGNISVTNPAQRNSISWNGSVSICPGQSPSKAATWGAVKALYR
jgi:hypothetical protein